MLRRRPAFAALAAALAAVSASGCGAQAESPVTSSGEVNAAFTQQVQANVDKALAPQPALNLSGPAAVPGKRIAIVTITLAEATALRLAEGTAQAATDAGWTSTTYDGQGSPTTANAKLQQAVTTRPDAIVLIALEPTAVGSGLKAANDAKIPVSCQGCYDQTSPDFKGEYFQDVQPAITAFEDLGYLTAQFSYLETDGHPRFVSMVDPALSNLAARKAGLDRFMKECQDAKGDCKVLANKDFQAANATTTLPADAAALAKSNPDYNAFWAPFDFAAIQAVNGLRQAGLANPGPKFMVGSNGDGPNLEMIKSDGFIKATAAIGVEQICYVSIDNLNRIFSGEQPVAGTVPIRLFDKTNVDQANNGAWNGDVDYRAAYLKVWNP